MKSIIITLSDVFFVHTFMEIEPAQKIVGILHLKSFTVAAAVATEKCGSSRSQNFISNQSQKTKK